MNMQKLLLLRLNSVSVRDSINNGERSELMCVSRFNWPEVSLPVDIAVWIVAQSSTFVVCIWDRDSCVWPRFLIATEALDFYWLVFTLSLGRFVFPTWSVADLNLKLPPSALKHRFYWNENGEEISLNLNVLVSLDWSPWPRLPLLALHLRVCRS